MKSALSKLFSAAFCMIAGTPVLAQENLHILGSDAPNLLYGRYTVLDTHPDCAAPDQLAFQIPIEASNLDYVALDSANNLVWGNNNDKIETLHQCYVTERIGTEIRRTPVRCSQASTQPLTQAYDPAAISVGVNGTVTACLSPTNLALVDADWTVNVTHDTVTHRESGTGITPVVSANNDVSSQGDAGGRTRFRIHEDFFTYALWWQEIEENNPFATSFEGIDALSVEAQCIPLSRDTADIGADFVGFQTWFAIVDDHFDQCSGPQCPGTEMLRYNIRWAMTQDCDPI
ncbi:hypothetical protein [Yoonia sp. BS5-3]|uniref:Uncharacterized protein n=1 Tax=Yoonia phaeophyticola TaxID=3137369 RepID=A0ABZ2V6N2_9RHOB